MTSPAGPRPSDRFIPWYIVLFFAVQFPVFGWFYHIASSTYTGLVTDQAYEKGLRYNQVIAEASAQQQLGWRITISKEGGILRCALRDRDQKPLAGADVSLWLIRPVHGGIDQEHKMKENAPGVYEWPLDLPEKGLWEARIEAHKGGQRFQASQRMEF